MPEETFFFSGTFIRNHRHSLRTLDEISLLEKEKPIMKSHCLSDSLHITLMRSQTVERILKVRNNLIFPRLHQISFIGLA
jgi:hypothetical protein